MTHADQMWKLVDWNNACDNPTQKDVNADIHGTTLIPIGCPVKVCGAKLWDIRQDKETQFLRKVLCMVCGWEGYRRVGRGRG